MTSRAVTLDTLSARKVVNIFKIYVLLKPRTSSSPSLNTVHIPQSTTSAPVRKAPVTDSPITVTNAPVTEDSVNSVNSQCENEKAALNARIGLLSSVLQSKMAEIKELLSQNEKKTAELNENREKIQRLEMINHIESP